MQREREGLHVEGTPGKPCELGDAESGCEGRQSEGQKNGWAVLRVTVAVQSCGLYAVVE
jgi:hypothetical protein